MKTLVQRVSTGPKYAKAFEWGKLITMTGGTQLLVQGFGFISGIMVIRLLSTQEYALYTLANTMLGTMVMLADSGTTNGVMAEGGKVWQDKKKLGAVLATGLILRRRFGVISLIATVPILAYLLLEHGASWLSTCLIILAIVPAFFASLSDSFLEMAPKLHQDISPLQRNQAEVSLGRLVLSVILLFIFPFAYIGIVAVSIPRIYGNYKLRKVSKHFANLREKPDNLVKKNITIGVKRTMPIVLYHCISGQLAIWLVSFYGTTTNISEIGALSRISVIFTIFTTLFATLVVPRYARLNSENKDLLKHFLMIQGFTFIISTFLMFAIWQISDQILWILGKNYSGLNYELFLFGALGCIGLMNGICSQLIISRGWFMKPYYLIGINFFSTIIGLKVFNITSLIGVLYFNIVVYSTTFLLVFFFGLLQLNKNLKSIRKSY